MEKIRKHFYFSGRVQGFTKPEHPNKNDDISLMYFTSGTTGEPKM